MKKRNTVFTSLFVIGLMIAASSVTYAGNPDRAGEAGASELLINPWARSSGWAGANTAGCRGLESMYLNVAGTAFTRKTELLFDRTNWLVGTGIHISSFGFTQHVGETGAIGMGVMSMDFGDIPITTTDQPEGGLGTFSPHFVNLAFSYAKGFSDDIYGGVDVKVVSEAISDVSAKGVALDAGIQYVTGKQRNIKFGISLKNVGPRMRFSGDGLAFRTPLPNGNNGKLTVEQRSASFEMPSLVNIGIRYDFYFSKKDSTKSAVKTNRLSVAANFTSNSFIQDQGELGLEYAYKSFLMLRAGFDYEKGIFNNIGDGRVTAFTGPTAGFTVEIPFNKKKSTFGLDYSYRATNPFQGTHTIGARINL